MNINSKTRPIYRGISCACHICDGDSFTSVLNISSVDSHGNQRVFFVEEPVPTDGVPRMEMHVCPETGVNIVVPQMPEGLGLASQETILKLLLNNLLMEHRDCRLSALVLHADGAVVLAHLKPRVTVFDCMDELSAFKGAPQEMKDREAELLRRADVVFTGGQSLYEAKVGRHDHLYAFRAASNSTHFAQARTISEEPGGPGRIPHPRIGFAGVIDERMDIELLDGMARAASG